MDQTLFKEIKKGFGNLKNIMSVETITKNFTMPKIYADAIHSHAKFTKSQVHPKKVIHISENDNEHYFVIGGYTTFKRNVKVTKIEKKSGFFFKKTSYEYVSDEDEIISYLEKNKEDNKIDYKMDFDNANNEKCYWFYVPSYLILSKNGYDEIDRSQFDALRRYYMKYKSKTKRAAIDKKIKDIETSQS